MRSFAFRQIFAIRDHEKRSPPRSSELISNSTSVDASKNTCFKGHPETVLPSESTELQRKRRSRERIWELAAFQGAEVGLRMLQFLAISRDKIATESRSRRDGGGGSGIRTHVTVSRKHAFQACAFSHSATPPRVASSWRPTLPFASQDTRQVRVRSMLCIFMFYFLYLTIPEIYAQDGHHFGRRA
jgi:hypothetical protein